MIVKRIFLLVVDALDSAADGMPNIKRLGYKNADGVAGRLKIASAAHDTVTGHWELAGVVSEQPSAGSPEADTIMDLLKTAGNSVVTIGRVNDVFAGKGISRNVSAVGNSACMDKLLEEIAKDYYGLCFVSLPDAVAEDSDSLAMLDQKIGMVMDSIKRGDILMVTSIDGDANPLLVFGQGIKSGIDLGDRNSLADVAASISKMMRIPYKTPGNSFWADIKE